MSKVKNRLTQELNVSNQMSAELQSNFKSKSWEITSIDDFVEAIKQIALSKRVLT